MLDPVLLEVLRCPASGQKLYARDERLVSEDGGRSYDVVDGIPCLIPNFNEPTHCGYDQLMAANRNVRDDRVDIVDYINAMLVPTCGNLFQGVKLTERFPIPGFPAHLAKGLTLDIGCNWGRWSLGGAMGGHRMVGVDIHLESLFVARKLARKICPENQPYWVLADARYLPFAPNVFDSAVSYSVVQHFSRENARAILRELGRVLSDNGSAAIQMPNRNGIKTRLQLPRKRFDDGEEFDVRYYGIDQLLEMFANEIGPAWWDIDCYFGLNVHGWDKPLLPTGRKFIVDIAELCCWLGRKSPKFGRLADSVWINAQKPAA